jgi:DNA-binding transcriptional LysR family regulator
LETDYHIQIFQRSASGVTPTVEGQRFIEQAALVLREWNQLKKSLDPTSASTVEWKIALPRASYAVLAAANMVRDLSAADSLYVSIRECGCAEALKNVLEKDYHMAILRYPEEEHEQYQRYFARNHLRHEIVLRFHYQLLVDRESPLADLDIQQYSQLDDYIEIIHDDESVQAGAMAPAAGQYADKKYINIYERGSQFDLLRALKNAYIWASPVPPEILERQGLVQRPCPLQTTQMLDVLVYRQGTARKNVREFAKHLRTVANAVAFDGLPTHL